MVIVATCNAVQVSEPPEVGKATTMLSLVVKARTKKLFGHYLCAL